MNLLESISDRMAVANRPLFAITVAAVPCPDTPVILTLHWHAFVEEKIIDVEEAVTVSYTAIPSSALQLNHRWDNLATLDRAAMEAGWELGAWDVARAERVGCVRPGAESSEALECLQAFGASPYGVNGQQVVASDAPDAEELLNLAARRGYLMWMFRPVHGGIWAEVADDTTLRPDGTRTPPCPIDPVPPVGIGARRTVYRFGISGSPSLN
ncbi:MAG: diguanylate cyclase [Betaproteobacteria bacterium]